jgi:hypothetical protein
LNTAQRRLDGCQNINMRSSKNGNDTTLKVKATGAK